MLKYSYGPQSSQPFVWPGKGAGVGVAAVTWEEEANGPSPNIQRDGPWAFFRLLDQAQIQPLGGLRYRITFALGGHSQSLILEAGSALNPLAQSAWRGFSCD
jgi:type VI secretion system protein ImpL